MCIDKLDDILNKYNNTCYRTTKMKPSTYLDSSKETNDKDSKFKIDIVRISKWKIIFAKGCFLNWPEKVFVIKIVENTVSWTYVISDLNGERVVGTFYEKELQKQNKKSLELKK